MSRATVSVVLATYNGERFIAAQIESLIAQQHPPAELIVCDDGSTDATVDLIAELGARAGFPIVIHRNPVNLGYAENFLAGSRLAISDYVAFCDQDDVWRDDKLLRAVDALQRTDALLYVHAARAVDEHGRPISIFRQRIRRSGLEPPLSQHPWVSFYGFSMVFPRRVLTLIDPSRRGLHPFEHRHQLSHDMWIHFVATSLGSTYRERKPLADYRQHGANQTPHIARWSLRRWTTSLGRSVDFALSRAEIAEDRAGAMSDLALSSEDSELAKRAAAAAEHWIRLSRVEAARIELYQQGSVTGRLARWVSLARRDGYASFRRGGLGPSLMVKDLLAGVLGLRRRPTTQAVGTVDRGA